MPSLPAAGRDCPPSNSLDKRLARPAAEIQQVLRELQAAFDQELAESEDAARR